MTPDDIIIAARSALGIPFQHQGRTSSGMDCVGLLLYVADRLGIEYTDVSGYSRRPSGGLIESTFDAHVESGTLLRIDPDRMQSGDFLMMRFGRDPQHLAIFTGSTIVHAYETVGKVAEHRLDEAWERRIVRVYRFTGVLV